jgi:hypothetical protein
MLTKWLRLAFLDEAGGVGACFPTQPYERSRISFQNIFWKKPLASVKSHAPTTSGDRKFFQNVLLEEAQMMDKSKIISVIMLI